MYFMLQARERMLTDQNDEMSREVRDLQARLETCFEQKHIAEGDTRVANALLREKEASIDTLNASLRVKENEATTLQGVCLCIKKTIGCGLERLRR